MGLLDGMNWERNAIPHIETPEPVALDVSLQQLHKGDRVECIGVGYPHWKGEIFEITLVFPNGDIGVMGRIRASSEDFKKI